MRTHYDEESSDDAAEAVAALLDALARGDPDTDIDDLLSAVGRAASPQAKARLRESHRRARDSVATLQQRLDRLRDVHEAAGELVAIRNLDVVLKAITSRARRLLRCDSVYLNTPAESDEQVFAVHAWSGSLPPGFRGIRVSPGHGVGGVVLETGEPFQVEDYLTSTDFAHEVDFDSMLAQSGIRTLLGVPLTVSDRTTGLLFAARQEPLRFSDEDVFLLSTLATHAAIAMQNAQLNQSREHALEELSYAMADSEQKRRAADRGARMHVALSSIVIHGGSITDILEAVRAELGLALAYVDRTRTTPTVTESGETGKIPDISLLHTPTDSTLTPGLRSLTVGSQRWAIVDVAVGGRLLGHLLTRWSALPDQDIASMLERAGQAVALSQLSTQALAAADRRTATELISKLVQTPQHLTSELARRAQRSGIDANGPAMALTDTTDPAVLQLAEDWTATNGGLAAVLDDVLTVFAPARQAEHVDQLTSEILHISDEANVIQGRTPRGLPTTPADYLETRRALMLARALGYTGTLLNVEQFGVFSLLFTDPTKPDLETFIRAHIGPLLNYDARHNTNLVATALALLENNLSPKAAATALEIHSNTVNQRAGRIDRLLHPDWRVQPRAFEVLAALKLYSLQSSVPK